mmetsp:Transcript_20783/g.46862  ORF Transcript_20783/g.46862 Transcript_20783/m.46862 type:complete len:374 (+) Transcript_20783:20-1141(+)
MTYPFEELAAPPQFLSAWNTSRGTFEVLVDRSWSPHGADRLYSLIRAGYYDDSRFFRAVPHWIVQFGVAGDPALAQALKGLTFPNDPVKPTVFNGLGYLSFAPHSGPFRGGTRQGENRSTELFINLAPHPELDALGLTPVGRVTLGMDQVVSQIYSGYGEMADACPESGYVFAAADASSRRRRLMAGQEDEEFPLCLGPNASVVYGRGSAWLDAHFPKLDRIRTVTVTKEYSEKALHGSVEAYMAVLVILFLFSCASLLYGMATPASAWCYLCSRRGVASADEGQGDSEDCRTESAEGTYSTFNPMTYDGTKQKVLQVERSRGYEGSQRNGARGGAAEGRGVEPTGLMHETDRLASFEFEEIEIELPEHRPSR